MIEKTNINLIIIVWLTVISILGITLFTLSFIEDQIEENEKKELEKRLLLIERKFLKTA